MAYAASEAGIDTSRLLLDMGSSTNGIAYRVYDRGENDNRQHWPYGPFDGFLGMTRNEAVKALNLMTSVFAGFADRSREEARNG